MDTGDRIYRMNGMNAGKIASIERGWVEGSYGSYVIDGAMSGKDWFD
jgi:hypothetical protein